MVFSCDPFWLGMELSWAAQLVRSCFVGLITLFKESQVGCFVSNLCVAALAYADDVAL